jgi:hypothetical protein
LADQTENDLGYGNQPVQCQDPYEDQLYFIVMRLKIILHFFIIYNTGFIAIGLML